jgi:COP9 signalosome complex subunit 1
LKLAVQEAKRGRDTKRYTDAQKRLSDVAPSDREAQHDTAWYERVTKQNAVDTHKLESELKGYKNNLIKESIRVHFTLTTGHWKVNADD